MTLKLVKTELRRDIVTFLSNVDIEYVSLVKCAATRVPARVVKGDREATASDVAKQILTAIKKQIDEQLKALPEKALPSVEQTTVDVTKLNQSIADTRAKLVAVRSQLDSVDDKDLDDIDEQHRSELGKALAKMQATGKSDWDEGKHPRADDGQFSSGGGGGSSSGTDVEARRGETPSPTRLERIETSVSSAIKETHDGAVTTGKIAKALAGVSATVAVVAGVVMASVPHPAAKAALLVVTKAAAAISAAAEVTAIAAHETERGLADHVNTKKEDAVSFEIIQSIIAPVGKDIEALRELYGEEWYSRVVLDNKAESETEVRYIQKSDSHFDPNAAMAFRDAGYGLQFVVGKLAETVKADDTCLRVPTQIKADGIEDTTTVGNLDPDPMGTPIVEDPHPEPHGHYPEAQMGVPAHVPDDDGKLSFGDLFYQKNGALCSGVLAAMELSEDPGTRRKTVKQLMTSFHNFVMAALDKVDAGGLKGDMKAEDVQPLDDKRQAGGVDSLNDNDKNGADAQQGDDEMALFETKEEMAVWMAETMRPVITETVKAEIEAAKPPESEADKAAKIKAQIDKLQAELDALTIKHDALTTKHDELEHQTVRSQTARDDEGGGTPATKGDKPVSAWGRIRPVQTSGITL